MHEELSEWVSKAEGDYFSALREYRARKHVNNDAACFHAQQCVEKYLKAVLVKHEFSFGKTHDLLPLLSKCLPAHPLWESWVDDAEWLTQYSVLFRYPGESATREDARQAVRIVKAMRPDLRSALGLTAED